MEKEVKLFIGEDELDIYDDAKLKLAVTYSIANINKIISRSGSFSKTLTIPASPTNKQAFGFVEEINSASGFDQTEIRDARIEIDGYTILQGVAKITNAIPDKRGNVTEYKIVILGELGDWKNGIRGLDLRDLDYNDQDHTYTKANIDASEVVSPSRQYVYPLESRGDFKIKVEFDIISMLHQSGTTVRIKFPPATDLAFVQVGNTIDCFGSFFDVNNQLFIIIAVNNAGDFVEVNHPDNSFGVFDEFGSAGFGTIIRKNAVGVQDRYPAIRVGGILTRIFGEQGYAINSTINAGLFQNLYIPFGGEKFQRRDGFEKNEEFRAGFLADFTTPTQVNNLIFPSDIGDEFFDTGNRYNTVTGQYVVAVRARMRFFVNFLASRSPSATMLVSFKVNGNNTFQKFFGITPTPTNILFETPFFEVEPGDTIQILVQGNAITFDKDGTSFYNEVLADVVRDGDVDIAASLPDMKQPDFIKGIKELFNLYFTTDVANKVVSFETRDEFFTGEVQDWTDKLDHDDERNVSFLGADLNKTIEYGYMNDSNDAVVSAINSEEDVNFGSVRFDIANAFAKDGIGKRENPVFSATIMASFLGIGLVTTRIPRYWSNEQSVPPKSTDFAPRILFYEGVVDVDEGDKWQFEGDTRTTYPYMFSYNDRDDTAFNLMYADRLRAIGLFNRFFRNLHSQIDKGRKLTARFFLDEKTIARLDFREPILLRIDGEPTLYHLNMIPNHNPILSRTTKVELIKITDDVPVPAISTNANNPEQPSEDDTPQEEITQALIYIDIDGNIMMSGNNVTNVLKALILGDDLIATKFNQILIGKNNVEDADAEVIIATGTPGNPKNALTITGGGGLKVGTGYIFADINNLTMPVYFTDANGETKLVQK